MTDPYPLGDLVLAAARRARVQAVLCAPFCKEATLGPLLDAIDSGIPVELFTRWRPEEIAAGVSDTGVLAEVERRGGSVHLHDPLHAKLFRFDDRALVGSANLTASALGWSANANLELLVETSATLPEIAALEATLREESIAATAEIAAEVERAAALLPTAAQLSEKALVVEADDRVPWHPLLREPRDLFIAYSEGVEKLTSASASAASSDLASLDIPAGFSRAAFESVIGTRLLQAPVVQAVDRALGESQRFGMTRDLLGEMLDMERREASHAWQTLMRWLLYFLPGRYDRTIPSYSEIMVRRDPKS